MDENSTIILLAGLVGDPITKKYSKLSKKAIPVQFITGNRSILGIIELYTYL